MVVVPSGSFLMGSPGSELARYDNETPQHRVTIPSFAVGVYEVTFEEFDACVAAEGCGDHRAFDRWGRERRPVHNIYWDAAQVYVAWLSRVTGAEYRLLSESEWEYVARAGTSTRFWWGDDVGVNRANCQGCASQRSEQTVPVGSFSPNAFGVYDMNGNVQEWVRDCWNDSYYGAPRDGRAWTSGDCSQRVMRGGSWSQPPRAIRSAYRGSSTTNRRSNGTGFRVARTITP